MASDITPGNIDGAYPIAGIDNDSQGFRTNFTNTSTNLAEAKAEIEDLQAKAVLKAPLTGESVTDNDMLGEQLKAATLIDTRETLFAHGALAGAVVVDHQNGQYQTVSTSGSIALSFTNFPGTGGAPVLGRVRVAVDVTNLAHTVTFPSNVVNGLDYIYGIAGLIVTFSAIGIYVFEFTSYDSVEWTVTDLTRGALPNDAFDIVLDTTPSLGGPLDVNGNAIISVTNGDITITPDGTGKTKITSLEAPMGINTQVGTTYIPVLSDAEIMITMDNAAANTITIPANATVAYPIGTKLNFMQLGAGVTTIAITADALNSAGSLFDLNGQSAVASALKVTATTWTLFGNLA